MMELFKRYVIGGDSGKREQAWLVFVLWCVGFGWAAFKEASGAPIEGTQAILSVAIYPVIVNLVAAHGMEWFGSQSSWGRAE